jgi:hypothetical protein
MPEQHVTLAEKIARAKAAAGGRGYAVTYTGPAAQAHVDGCVDGYDGRANAAASYPTITEQEAYDLAWNDYRRLPKDRHGQRYEHALF